MSDDRMNVQEKKKIERNIDANEVILLRLGSTQKWYPIQKECKVWEEMCPERIKFKF